MSVEITPSHLMVDGNIFPLGSIASATVRKENTDAGCIWGGSGIMSIVLFFISATVAIVGDKDISKWEPIGFAIGGVAMATIFVVLYRRRSMLVACVTTSAGQELLIGFPTPEGIPDFQRRMADALAGRVTPSVYVDARQIHVHGPSGIIGKSR